MFFDPENTVVKLCAQGMELEGQGNGDEAQLRFEQAWAESTNDTERCIAAHYVARHQKSIADKLLWDKIALDAALTTPDTDTKVMLPSLYLNVGKCYEDMHQDDDARENYEKARSFTHLLTDDGYGKMIRAGIENGLQRVK